MKKNIIFVSENSFPYYSGGIENWLYNMIVRLYKDYKVYVVSEPPTFYKKSFYDIPQEIKIINYTSRRRYKWYRAFLKGDLGFWDYRLREQQIYHALINLLKDLNNDSIIVALGTIAVASACYNAKKKMPSVRFICSARGPHAEIMSRKYSRHSTYLYETEELNLKHADVALTNGFDTKKYFEERGIKTIVMKNGVDFDMFQQPSTEKAFKTHDKVVLSIGTLWDVKCISELIKALAIIVSKGRDDISLFFAGKGDSSKYQVEAIRLGVEEKVFFLGHRKDIPTLSQQADLIACLSEGGGFSMAALEAMASGTPVIAWDTPVYSQFNSDEERISLVPFKSIENLSEGIIKCLDNPEEVANKAGKARSYAATFDWSYVVKDFIRYVDNQD